ncbi:hypothetical protein HYH03_015203 [Edaphochlamys debaryana]|uniref:Rhodanese domain-containing protein n=1 Tax=Edaphochlamys debaryana TaxID=47281 RepID=A0A835XL68_9CHLO|nr:hypothetical protein HYH03_015203 [Edaphochlamys debaryana]|eukprot:KAG2486108.1 hypothetical protein HYH03_015203 [Edaphochlamys debaryana]
MHAHARTVGPLVDLAWLQRNLEEVRIYDARGRAEVHGGSGLSCSGDYDAYLEGHVPGAVFVSWVRDGVAAGSNGGPPLLELDPDAYVPTFEARGLSAEIPVVVYDDGSSLTAVRVWWQLTVYGAHPVAVLEGGWNAWKAAGLKQELYEPCPLKLSSVFEAEPAPQHRATAQELHEAAAEGSARVVLVGTASHPALPGAVIVTPAQLLASLGDSAVSAGAQGGMAAVLASASRVSSSTLAAGLSEALGCPVGPSSRQRVLLASPQDAALSACGLALLLAGAGHKDWAVCEELHL